MGSMEHLRVLSLRANDMVQEVSSSFEEHFLWLDEVLAEARHTLASEDLVLLPKTPSAAPKRTRRIIKEDAENSPPLDFSSPPTRRGRLCSKLASQKIQEQVQMSRIKKLRRPSSPLTQVPPTAGHRNTRRQAFPSLSPSRSDDEPSKSPAPEAVQVTPSSSRCSNRSVKLVLDPSETSTPPSVPTSSRKDPGIPQKDNGSSKESLSSLKKNESSQQNESPSPLRKEKDTFQMDDASLKDHSSSAKSSSSSPQQASFPAKEVTSSPDISSSVREVSHSPKEVGCKVVSSDVLSNYSKTHKGNVEQGNMVNHSQNSTKGTVVSQILPQEEEDLHLQLDDSYGEIVPLDDLETSKGKEKEGKEEDMQVVWESSEVKEKPEQVTYQSHPSVSAQAKVGSPSPKVTSTRQKPVGMQDIPAAFAPAPRVTRTKQRALDAQAAQPPSSSEPQPPSAPSPRVRHTKQKTVKVQEMGHISSTDSLPHPPSSPTPAPRVTRTKQKAVAVPDVPASTDSLPEPASPSSSRVTYPKQEVVKIQRAPLPPESLSQPPSVPAPRMTRTKQRAIEVQEATASVPQPAARVTRTKQKTREDQQPLSRNVNSGDEEEKTFSGIQQNGEDKGLKSNDVKDSGVYSLGIRTEGCGLAESVSSGGTCAPTLYSSSPPRRITRSKMSKLQQAQHSPKALPSIPNFQRACCSPRGTRLSQSPHKDSPASRRKLAVQSGRDGVEQLMSETSHSPARVVRHSPDKAGKVMEARVQMMSGSAGRITPSFVSRMQPYLTASSSSASSSSTEHKRIIKRTVGTPNESRRPANIVTGITSFIKSQPVRPTREEVEEQRLQEYQRKKEREEDTLRKKEQLLRAKAEEQKRRNEERMRRVQETLQERERLAVAAKEKQERERRQREEQEQQRRQQLAKRKAEEEARKVAKLKEQQEERKRLEEEKKQKIEEEKRRQRHEEEERIRYYASKKKLEEQMKMKMAMTQMLKKKHEVEQPTPKETLPIHKENEQQALRQPEAKTVKSTYKETGALNTTYTKPVADERVDSYEMTPVQPKRASSSLNNYNIEDLQSDDSTDDDASPKKKIPQWAMKTQLRAAIMQQEHFPPQLEEIFPSNSLLVLPDLTQIFPKQKRRFRKRTSSAQWGTPPSKVFRVTSFT